MGNYISRGTLDVIYILFPFVLSAGLIIMIIICWWKCKLYGSSNRRDKRDEYDCEGPDFGHLINIQEYAENQVGTTIVYADSPVSGCPHPYVYFSDGHITKIVPLTPSQTFSALNHHQDHSHASCPSALLCNNISRQNRKLAAVANRQSSRQSAERKSSSPGTQATVTNSTSITSESKNDDEETQPSEPSQETTTLTLE